MTGPGFERGVQLRHLRCLVAVAQEGHLARAADRLALSQPAVSKTLAELEALVGQRLVDRGRRGAVLTAAGQTLLPHALRATQALQDAQEALAPSGATHVPRVRVGSLPSAGPALLPAAIASFQRQHPHVRMEQRTAANAALLQALQGGELDLVLGRMADPSLMAGLSFELLHTEPLLLAVRAGHPLARAQRPALQEVLRYPLLVFPEGTVPRHNTESLLSALGLALPSQRTETQDVAVARLLAAGSDAVWFAPSGVVQDDIRHRRLAALAMPTPGTEEPVGLILRSGQAPSPVVAALAAVLREARRA